MVHESGQDPVELAWGRSVSCITAVKVRQTDRRCTSQTSVAAKSTNRGLGAAGSAVTHVDAFYNAAFSTARMTAL